MSSTLQKRKKTQKTTVQARRRHKSPREEEDDEFVDIMDAGMQTDGMSDARRRAMWAQSKFSKLHPWKDWGAMRVQRGTDSNINTFGRTFRSASDKQKANRKLHGYAGRGSYFGSALGAIKRVGKDIGLRADKRSKIGKAYKAAMDVDRFADRTGISRYLGMGEYSPMMSTNELISGSANASPVMRSVDDETGSMLVTHRERVADIIAPGNSGFDVQSFDINPGLEKFAPWLHQLAACFEEYQVMQCVYEYHGHDLIGIQNSLDLQGQVIAATKYNVKLPEFTDRHEMTAYAHANQCSLNGKLVHGVEAHPAKVMGDGHKLVRVGGLAADEDKRDYDHGRFSLAVNNTPSDLYNKEIGQLYVYYTVKLIKPKISTGRGQAISVYRQFCKDGASDFPFGDPASTGTGTGGVLIASKNTMDMTYIPGGAPTGTLDAHTWRFPKHAAGVYRVCIQVSGASLDGGAADLSVNSGDFVGNVTLLSAVYPAPGGVATTNARYVQGGGSSTEYSEVTFYVAVRPSTTNNDVIIKTTFTGDNVLETAVTIEEVNTLGNETGLPECKRLADGAVVPL